MFVMFLITLAAVGAAVGAWLRPIPHETPAPPAAPTYSEQQVSDAKAKVCAAVQKVHHATDVNAVRNGGDDPNVQLMVATTQRQVFVIGSAYLMTTLAEAPAAPSDLAAIANNLAHLYQVATLDGLAGSISEAVRNSANDDGFKIDELCK
jgi:hypothetical protein